ncbi:hypothetical protein CICLE_v10003664mg [Citrus x clementina]|uniref:Calcium-transporting P-type ATPase N-terminal autoinhibitory domain-containing protein n=2 Tax=Citrus TaxID=2706 RepID=A0A067EDU5_CITSI|nr:hypothetical protein CICLE_v10003664mg [Citrus x clementina]KDO52065.1 hypothetical protein CISIN_1g040305mg [Citrus sinensis]
MFFNSEDFDVQPWRSVHPSEEALKRWRSACAIVKNRRRRFCMVTNLANHAEARDHKLKIQVLFYSLLSFLLFFIVETVLF